MTSILTVNVSKVTFYKTPDAQDSESEWGFLRSSWTSEKDFCDLLLWEYLCKILYWKTDEIFHFLFLNCKSIDIKIVFNYLL